MKTICIIVALLSGTLAAQDLVLFSRGPTNNWQGRIVKMSDNDDVAEWRRDYPAIYPAVVPSVLCLDTMTWGTTASNAVPSEWIRLSKVMDNLDAVKSNLDATSYQSVTNWSGAKDALRAHEQSIRDLMLAVRGYIRREQAKQGAK